MGDGQGTDPGSLQWLSYFAAPGIEASPNTHSFVLPELEENWGLQKGCTTLHGQDGLEWKPENASQLSLNLQFMRMHFLWWSYFLQTQWGASSLKTDLLGGSSLDHIWGPTTRFYHWQPRDACAHIFDVWLDKCKPHLGEADWTMPMQTASPDNCSPFPWSWLYFQASLLPASSPSGLNVCVRGNLCNNHLGYTPRFCWEVNSQQVFRALKYPVAQSHRPCPGQTLLFCALKPRLVNSECEYP